MVRGQEYSGVNGPDGVVVDAGDLITWESDANTPATGFEICGKFHFFATMLVYSKSETYAGL